MSKLGWYGLLTFVLFGCGASKLKPNELFLSPDSGSEKIYILSAFPEHADSSGLYLSALLVKHTDEENRQLTAFVTTYNRSTQQVTTSPFFTDSLMLLDGTRFPLLLKSVSSDSLSPAFTFSLDRNSLELTADYSNGQEIEQKLVFPKQKPFKSTVRGTKFKLTAIKPLQATLTKWNDQPTNQSSDLMLHTVDNGELLFESQPNIHYCWLDCRIDGNNYSLFFQYDSLGKITPVYSTFPEGAPHSIEPNSIFEKLKQPGNQSSSTFTMNFTTENGFDNVTIKLAPQEQNRVLTKNTFSVRAVDVLINNRLTGTGILYIL
jgi:hypothetical protein